MLKIEIENVSIKLQRRSSNFQNLTHQETFMNSISWHVSKNTFYTKRITYVNFLKNYNLLTEIHTYDYKIL